MKIRLVVALVGLTISFAVPAFAQQKETIDPNILEQLAALGKKNHEAWSKNDAAALAETYTEDAILVTRTQDRFTVGRPSRNIIQTCSSKSISATILANGINIPRTS